MRMSADGVEHQATVEKGLRMKIKRKTPSTTNPSSTAPTTSGSKSLPCSLSASSLSDAKGSKSASSATEDIGLSRTVTPRRTGGGSSGNSSDDRDRDDQSSPVGPAVDQQPVLADDVPSTHSSSTAIGDDKSKKKSSSGGGSSGRTISNTIVTSSKSGRPSERGRNEVASASFRKEPIVKKNSSAVSTTALTEQRNSASDGGVPVESVDDKKAETKLSVAANRKRSAVQSSTSSTEITSSGTKLAKVDKASLTLSVPVSSSSSTSFTSDSSVHGVKIEENNVGEKPSVLPVIIPAPTSTEISKGDGQLNAGATTVSSGNGDLQLNSSVLPCSTTTTTSFDPYEFVTKLEENVLLSPMKKFKSEKIESHAAGASTSVNDVAGVSVMTIGSDSIEPPADKMTSKSDVGTATSNVSVMTDPDCLGPCEPGTSIVLEGIVWSESNNGILVVNVTWRGKTYVGTLMDATKHHWSSPRFQDETQLVELDWRSPKGKRSCTTPVGDAAKSRRLRKSRRSTNANSVQSKTGPNSPSANVSGGSDGSGNGVRGGRKGRTNADCATSAVDEVLLSRKSLTVSLEQIGGEVDAANGVMLECTGLNCNKKYKHINGLRYHQSHAHKNEQLVADDALPLSAVSVSETDEKCSVVDGRAGVTAQCESSSDDGITVVPSTGSSLTETIRRYGASMELESEAANNRVVPTIDEEVLGVTALDRSTVSVAPSVDEEEHCRLPVLNDGAGEPDRLISTTNRDKDVDSRSATGDLLMVSSEEGRAVELPTSGSRSSSLLKSNRNRLSSPDVKLKLESSTGIDYPYGVKEENVLSAPVSVSVDIKDRENQNRYSDDRSLEIKYRPQSPFRSRRPGQQPVVDDESSRRSGGLSKTSTASSNRPDYLPLPGALGASQQRSQPVTGHRSAHLTADGRARTPSEDNSLQSSREQRSMMISSPFERSGYFGPGQSIAAGTPPSDFTVASGLDPEMFAAIQARDAAVRRHIEMLNGSPSVPAVSSAQMLMHGGPSPLGTGAPDDYARLAVAVYGYGMDPSTAAVAAYQAHMMAAANPEYRVNYERWMVEQQQRYHQQQLMAVAAAQHQQQQQQDGTLSASASSAGGPGRPVDMSGLSTSANSHGSRGSSPHSRSSMHQQSSAGHRYDRDRDRERAGGTPSSGQPSRSDRGSGHPIKTEKSSFTDLPSSSSSIQRKDSSMKQQRDESGSTHVGHSSSSKWTENSAGSMPSSNADRSRQSKALVSIDSAASLYSAPNLLLPSLSPSSSGKLPQSSISRTQPPFESIVQPYPSLYPVAPVGPGSSMFDTASMPPMPSSIYIGASDGHSLHGKTYKERSSTGDGAGRRPGGGSSEKSSRLGTSSPSVAGVKSSSWSKDKLSDDGSRPFLSGPPSLSSDKLSTSGIDPSAAPGWNEKISGGGLAALGPGNPGGAGPLPGQQQSAGSPLTLRHLHTHHHTHVVQSPAGYPLYGLIPPVPAIVSPVPPALPVPQSFIPK